MTVQPGQTIAHGGGLAAAARLYGGSVEDWLDLSTGINPCPPDLPAIDARAWHRLPDREREDTARLAARDFYRSGTVLPLPVPGTQSVIQLLPKLMDAGRRAAILSPTYGEYARSLTLAGISVDAVDSLEAMTSAHGLAVVVNPNNPTGRQIGRAELVAVAQRMAVDGGLLLVDEAFADAQPEQSLAPLVAEHANLVLFRSFGKFFGLAGLRLGFVIADQVMLDRFACWLGPWAVSGPALSVATQLFSADHHALRTQIVARKAALDAVLAQSGLTVIGSTPLFALVEHTDAANLHAHLARVHILTRIFEYAPGWLRIGLTPDEDADARLLAALQAFRS
ncbi:threonine-phosphate decarboxylase [Agrobacterium vitis]|uniref:threonine-phosphate decarboxylase n=1 Tax=Agrobacterium vitis TaxID=373 RepID=A0ABD6GEC4_AGRVI|nr:threonine-phosphate decarboxylase CobD [Agrobacterium vitis]MUO77825.1 threonine-phosphate decarboxylase [Agrobacterium vitis]MUO93343.1 threonine-phosphate decarboxylase [Agrobacterium vitis]MUP04694.1 threonine-phosphate decarboxylase [Agrobacterium vitis]MUZ80869.1 threonine-phosphate decarboxylase [Agrobacterium vitis]MVA08946.1 threonine-phosphate decarboxylase [Agrobacterium vitis]